MIIQLDGAKEQNSVLQTKANDYDHSMLTMSKKLNKSETRNIALTRFVKETTRNHIQLKNGQSITVYDAIMNKLSPEDKTRVRKTMDLEGNKNNRNRWKKADNLLSVFNMLWKFFAIFLRILFRKTLVLVVYIDMEYNHNVGICFK